MFFKSSLLKLSTSPLPSFTVSPELHLTSYFTKNTERIKISMSSQHQSHPPHCIWPRILYFLPSEMDDLLMLSAKSAPSFTCSFILQISNLSSLPLSDRYGAQMPHLPAPLVGMATTNPAFAHLTIYFPVSHFPVPHNGPKIPGKIKILSSLVAV